MDHTPGQRQWRDLAKMKTYTHGQERAIGGRVRSACRHRGLPSASHVPRNWPIVVELFRRAGIPLATHDDTTVEHVEAGVASGAVISEFPTTVEAAAAAKQRGLATIAGAPNVVRGGSHSGGVSVRELAERGVLDGLSSDYVPSSLLQAVHQLGIHSDIRAAADAMGMVTWRIADMLGLSDRGRMLAGLPRRPRAVPLLDGTPVVRGLWSAGRQVLH